MTRESAAVKARRYLAEGRLIITSIDGYRFRATCRGDGAVYRLTVSGEDWDCTCPARGRCAHLIALGAVTATTKEIHPMTDHALDPALDHLRHQLHRLVRGVHRLDAGSRVQLAGQVDDYLDRLDDDPSERKQS